MSNMKKIKASPPPLEIKITEELADEARRSGWSGGEMVATAIARAAKAAGWSEDMEVEMVMGPNPEALKPELRNGYTARPDPRG